MRATVEERPFRAALAGEKSRALAPEVAADESIDPSARKERGPQDDNKKASSVPSVVNDLDVFRTLVAAGRRLAESHVRYEDQPEWKP